MSKPKKGARKAAPASEWRVTGNDRRKRPMVTLTLAEETVAKLDRIKGDRSRGEIVDELVARVRDDD